MSFGKLQFDPPEKEELPVFQEPIITDGLGKTLLKTEKPEDKLPADEDLEQVQIVFLKKFYAKAVEYFDHEVLNFQQNILERKQKAKWVFVLLCGYYFVTLFICVGLVIAGVLYPDKVAQSADLFKFIVGALLTNALVSTTGIFIVIIKYLFNIEHKGNFFFEFPKEILNFKFSSSDETETTMSARQKSK